MTDALSLVETMRRARKRLNGAGSVSAEIDAQLIVEHVTGTTRLDAITRPEQPIPALQIAAIEAAVERCAGGEPVHRILGAREFYGLRMTLSPQTLEPRPDTETLVDAVLPFAKERAHAGSCRILDLGTGTGAILIALLAEVRNAKGLAVDISAEALETATRNADLNGVGNRFSTLASDWFERLDDTFDLIVSNPPYIATRDVAELDHAVRSFDPGLALDGGADGLDCYRMISAGARAHLADGGRIGVEIGYDQEATVTAIFEAEGFRRIEARKDLSGNDRVLIFQPYD